MMAGWCPSASAIAPSVFANFCAEVKSLNLYVRCRASGCVALDESSVFGCGESDHLPVRWTSSCCASSCDMAGRELVHGSHFCDESCWEDMARARMVGDLGLNVR